MLYRTIMLISATTLISACGSTNTKELYEDGSTKAVGKTTMIVDGKTNEKVSVQDGRSQGWHRNGVKSYDMTYSKGKIVGESRFWHPNGTLAGIDNHDDKGYAHGIFKRWDKSGKLLKEFQFVRGTGKEYYFYASGELKAIIPYVDGEASAEGVYYNADGSIKEKVDH